MNDITVVVGGQAGSEGKGAVCDQLHRSRHFEYAVRVGGPNAGHTVVDQRSGEAVALRQLPVAAISDPNCHLVIAGGSEVDLSVLVDEVLLCERLGYRVSERLYVDSEATWMRDTELLQAEEQRLSNGTTGKGIGAARSLRAMRESPLIRDALADDVFVPGTVCETTALLNEGRYARILVEGTQGYVLGSHAGYYPHCTSGDCRAIDALAMAGLNVTGSPVEVWNVLRTYPIRIAGNSGPMADETSWEELGLTPEKTTVTKKVRRVGHWDWDWAQRSCRDNGGAVALTFADYTFPELAGESGSRLLTDLPASLELFVREIDRRTGCPVKLLGTGPSTALWVA